MLLNDEFGSGNSLFSKKNVLGTEDYQKHTEPPQVGNVTKHFPDRKQMFSPSLDSSVYSNHIRKI
jgi:hypothetical protein